MKIVILFLFSAISISASATSSLEIGQSYNGDLRILVTEESGEIVTDEMVIDINLDGQKEIALGVTCGNAGCIYHIFKNEKKDVYKYLGHLFFHSKAIEINLDTKVIKTYVRSNAEKGCDYTYQNTKLGFIQMGKACK